MNLEKAKEILLAADITFEISDSCFGDGSVVISSAEVFDTKEEAEEYIQALEFIKNL